MIFQQHHLIGRLSALQNVLVGRVGAHTPLRSMFPLPRADQRIALQALERVGLLERALIAPTSFPAGNNSASASPGRWHNSLRWSWPMSR